MVPLWENGRLVRLTLTGPGYDSPLTHHFSYDDRTIRHVCEGNLTGEHPEGGERYATEYGFDGADRLVMIREQNGRTRTLTYRAESVVVSDVGPTWHLRSETSTDGTYEALDNGTESNAPSWKLWWRHQEGEECGSDVVLRREENTQDGYRAYDSEGKLLIQCAEEPNRTRVCVETPEQAMAFLAHLASLQTPPIFSQKGGGIAPMPGLLSTRKEISPEEVGGCSSIRRTLDGHIHEVRYTDGRRQLFRRDGLGRVLELESWEKGASSSRVMKFFYDGPHLVRMETPESTILFSLDVFRRIVRVEKSGKIQEVYTIGYDPLDRIVSLTFEGTTKTCVRQLFSIDGGCERWLEIGEAPPFVATFDQLGRLVQYEKIIQNSRQLLLKNTFSSRDGKAEIQTEFGDHSKIAEEFGKAAKRVWFDGKGTSCLEEQFNPLDDQGSMRLTQTAGITRSVEWTVAGNHVSFVKGTGGLRVTYGYDEKGRLVTKKTGAGRQIHFVWDESGHLIRLHSEDQSIDYRFIFDSAGRIVEATDLVQKRRVVRTFDTEGRLIYDGEEEAACRASFDQEGRLAVLQALGIELRFTKEQVVWNDTIWKVQPLPDVASSKNISKQDGLGVYTQKATTDALHQLEGETGEYPDTYTFDALGTLSSKDGEKCQYDSEHRVIQIGKRQFSYDADGLLIEKREPQGITQYQYDALGRLSAVVQGGVKKGYRYDGFGRMREVIGTKNSQQIVWLGDLEIGIVSPKHTTIKVFHPTSRFCLGIIKDGKPYRAVTDCHGSITALYAGHTLVEVYRYSAFGNLHMYDSQGQRIVKGITPWRFCGKRWMGSERMYDFGARRYNPYLKRWMERDPLGISDSVDDQVFVHNNPVDFVDPTGLFAIPVTFASIERSLKEAYSHVSASVMKTITNARAKIAWIDDMRFGFEDTACEVVGRSWLKLIGYNLDSSKIDSLGKGKEASRVRITLINGFLNCSREIRSSANAISKTHGNVPVHFAYVATEGFTGDLLRAAISMAGRESYQVKMLVKLWKDLIKELGGVCGGGTIVHYAHSLGATDTYNALRFLNADERKMIHVSTFGAPTLLSDGICGQVDNYVSTKDGVPMLDFFRYHRGAPNIHFVPSAYPETFLPFTDHFFTGKTYGKVVEELGHKFQEEFLLK